MKVYLINQTGTDYYKIGYTSRPISKRLSEIQVGCPSAVRVHTTFETDVAQQVELAMHNRYSSKRSNGEWFILDSEDIKDFLPTAKRFEKGILALMESDNPFVKRKI